MVGLPSQRRRRGLQPARDSRSTILFAARRLGTLLYGRALYLPPPALPPRAYPPGHAIAEGLRPFRARVHRQRAAVTMLRALSFAAIVAIVVLAIRIHGTAVPMPLLPTAAAGSVLAVALLLTFVQRPAPAQVAHTLDQRLGLREQVGSALELDETDGYLAALLCQKAAQALRSANADFVLPWPSLQRERISFICLALVAGLCGLLAAHAPVVRTVASGATQAGQAGRHTTVSKGALRAAVLPLQLRALGAGAHVRLATGTAARQGVVAGAHAPGQGGLAGRGTSQNGLGLHMANGQQKAGPIGSTGNQAGQAGQTGGQGSRPSVLHLTQGKNSAAGGVLSQQQALQDLQNSISSATSPQGQPGASANQNNGSAQNGTGQQGQPGGNPGQRNSGQGNAPGMTRGHEGQQQQGGGQPAGSPSPGKPGSAYGKPGQLGPADGSDPMLRPSGSYAPGSGTGAEGAGNRANAQGRTSGARLGDSSQVVLNGAPGPGGRMILTVGLPNRGLAFNGGSLTGASTTPAITKPGYVAPDSNTVPADERGLIRTYFSPPSGSQ